MYCLDLSSLKCKCKQPPITARERRGRVKPEIYEKAKLLEGISQQEWNDLKRLVDEAFEQKKRELSLDVKLSVEIIEKIGNTNLF